MNTHGLASITAAAKLNVALRSALQNLWADIDISQIEVRLEHPKDKTHGDYACNIALSMAKQLGKNPKDIAAEIAAEMSKLDWVTAEVAGPGFINFALAQTEINSQVALFAQNPSEVMAVKDGEGKTVMVEFGQPNTHKAFHVGHLKSAISGLAMVGCFEYLGYKVIKANFYGDVGMQVAKCIWGYRRETLPANFAELDEHEKMRFLDDCYAKASAAFKDDPQAEDEIRQINKQIYARDPLVKEDYNYTRELSLEHLNKVFAELGVNFDVQYPESSIDQAAVQIVNDNMHLFKQSEGAIIYDGKEDGLTTWVFLTRENLPTYSAKDLALGHKKFEDYNLDYSVITTSVEQKDYFKAVIKVLEKIKPEITGKYTHIPFGWMLRDNKKTSSRMGGSVKGMDIIAEAKQKSAELISEQKDYTAEQRAVISDKVALAGLKFMILSHEFHKNFNYDPEKFITLNGYSGPYLLYTFARANSVLEKAGNKLEQITDYTYIDSELDLARLIITSPETIYAACKNIAPHLVCNYLYEVAQKFNAFYADKQIIEAETPAATSARLLLTAAVANILKNGLDILGIETLDQM